MINLKNCRVIIREQKKNSVLADTVILGHNLLTNIIKVRASAMAYRPKEPVGLLVFLENKIYSYLGTVQGAVIANEMSIALYDEEQKKGRKFERYEIEASGKIEGVRIKNNMITLHKPIPVTIKNMSANGVLFKGIFGCLDVGMQLQLYMDVTDSGMRYEYKVVRKQNSNPETEEYGCKMVAKKK